MRGGIRQQMNKREEIRKMLRKERLKRDLNFKEFGKLIGCTGRSVSYWETGKRNISLDVADKALKKLGITLEIGRNKE
nr:MAG TPA: helix-turn-helix domain protein [Caudoviricetes sp.]